MKKKRYAIIGTGGRAEMFYAALATDFRDTSELVALCDLNQVRMDYANKQLTEKYDYSKLPTYKADQFEAMIKQEKPDTIIVTTIDRTHHTYIIRAMHAGCDVISEKPMTVDEEKCQEIMDTVHSTGK